VESQICCLPAVPRDLPAEGESARLESQPTALPATHFATPATQRTHCVAPGTRAYERKGLHTRGWTGGAGVSVGSKGCTAKPKGDTAVARWFTCCLLRPGCCCPCKLTQQPHQGLQVSWPALLWYVPASHGWHVL